MAVSIEIAVPTPHHKMPEISTPISSRLAYVKTGTGPVIVLLHGFPESHTLWRNISTELATSFTIIMPDFPGSGNSILEHETTISQMADCVIAILDNEKVNKAVIAGHSMGGYVGFALAAAYPQRLAGLSLVHSIPAADDEEKKKARLRAIDIIQKGGKEAFVRQMVPNLFSPAFATAHPQVIDEQVALALQLPASSLVNYYQAMIGRADHTALVHNINFPLQWIIGLDDNVIFYKKILENCAKSGINFVSFYHGCGHMSMLEAPQKLISDLHDFAAYCYQ